jgi:butyrate kinase
MMEKEYRILCINPGSTSTKLALFTNDKKEDEINIEHSAEEIDQYPDIVSQLPMRKKAIYDYLEKMGVEPKSIDAIAARGCPAGRVYHAGAYAIDEDMVNACLKPVNAVHAMCLAPVIAYEWVKDFGIPAYNYDVVMVDEMKDVARISGLPEIKRTASCHVLNSKAVAREIAEKMGKTYDSVNLIMCHLGGGCSVSMHEHGRISDAVSNGEGTFSPSRAGTFANNALVKLCFSGQYTEQSLKDRFANRCGLVAYLGTNDCREVERRIEQGDQKAKLIYEAFAYNIAKDIGTMAVTVSGQVDGIVLTGGIAYSEMLTNMVKNRVEFIAPVIVRPGAIEMEALAAGVLRVLRKEEKAYTFAEPF